MLQKDACEQAPFYITVMTIMASHQFEGEINKFQIHVGGSFFIAKLGLPDETFQ